MVILFLARRAKMALPSPLLRCQPQIKRQRVGNRGVVDQVVRKVQTRLFRPAGLSELGLSLIHISRNKNKDSFPMMKMARELVEGLTGLTEG